jgi:hypothetical protein
MIYEIINPSDAYTIETQDFDVAAVACLMLGTGQYAFKPLEDGGQEVPLFLFGGHDVWCQEHFSMSADDLVGTVLTKKRDSLAACLESCIIGRLADRQAYLAGLELIDNPAKREKWRARWHDDRRSSMNDIGGRAYKMAAKLRAHQSTAVCEPAPQQVFTR